MQFEILYAQKNACLQDYFNSNVVHFILAGQLSEAWTKDSIPNKLVTLRANIENQSIDNGISLLQDSLKKITQSLCMSACDVIRQLAIDSRVSRYRNFLWIWHHLSRSRADYSNCLIREPGSQHEGQRLDVDHFIAHDFWVSDYLPQNGIDQTNPNYFTLCHAINQIGNCNIVEKTLNISMGKKAQQELHDFLVHCFGSEDRFNEACLPSNLCLANEMLSLDNMTPDDVVKVLEKRTQIIKDELVGYFSDLSAKLLR